MTGSRSIRINRKFSTKSYGVLRSRAGNVKRHMKQCRLAIFGGRASTSLESPLSRRLAFASIRLLELRRAYSRIWAPGATRLTAAIARVQFERET
jgi:hypothetical protein